MSNEKTSEPVDQRAIRDVIIRELTAEEVKHTSGGQGIIITSPVRMGWDIAAYQKV